MNKLSVLLLYVLIGIALFHVEDLYQNNDEELLIPAEKTISYSQDDVLIFESDNFSSSSYFEKVLDSIDLEYKILDSQVLTRKGSRKDVDEFYEKYPLLDIKLRTDHGYVYVISLPRSERRKQAIFLRSVLSDNPELRVSGLPYLNFKIGERSKDVKRIVLPSLLALSFFLILAYIRNFHLSFVLFLFPLSSIPISLNIIKYSFGEANLLSNLTPLVSFVVIFCLIVHLYFSLVEFKTYRDVFKHKAIPIVFMLLTTILGIFSLYLSNVPAIKSFAITSSLSLITSSLFVFILFPYLLTPLVGKYHRKTSFTLVPSNLPRSISYLLCFIPVILLLLTVNKLKVQVDALYFFPQNSRVVENIRYIEKNVIGTPVLEISVHDFDFKSKFNDLSSMIAIEHDLSKVFGAKSNIISKVQSVRNANYVYSGQKTVPDSYIAAAFLLGSSPSLQDLHDGYHIKVLSGSMNTDEYYEKLSEVEKIFRSYNLNYEFYGNYYNLMTSQSEIISTLFKSFFISLFIISFLVGIYLRSLKGVIIFLIINISPPLMTLSLFSLFGLSLNLATIMTFSISFGLIVDSTIHVLFSTRSKLNEHQKSSTVFLPMLFSSIVLFAGFLSFTFHQFVPIWQFGASVSITIFWGVFYDYFVLPSLE